jgi:hypothetical protein
MVSSLDDGFPVNNENFEAVKDISEEDSKELKTI